MVIKERKIIVDADSCPVKNEIVCVGKEFSVKVVFITSYAHDMKEIDGAKIIYVDCFSQSVDLFIANHLSPNDIVITEDIGLAAMCLLPGIKVISFRGVEYCTNNIDYLLANRHNSAKVRRGGGKTKGPKALIISDREKFVEILRKILNY